MTKVTDNSPANASGIEESARRAGSHDVSQFEFPPEHENNASIRGQIESQMSPVKAHLENLKSAWKDAKAAGDNELAKEIAAEVRTVNHALNAVGYEVASSGNLDPNSFVGHVTKSLTDLDMSVGRDLMSRVGSGAEEAAETLDNATGASSSAGATSTEADSWAGELMKDPDRLVREFESDPEAFFAKVGDLSSHVQKGLMMKLQGEIQEDNQLFSMLTNFMKAMHDTEKAIISNLRV